MEDYTLMVAGYWSKLRGGLIIGVMKCEACDEFKFGGIDSRKWTVADVQRFNSQ